MGEKITIFAMIVFLGMWFFGPIIAGIITGNIALVVFPILVAFLWVGVPYLKISIKKLQRKLFYPDDLFFNIAKDISLMGLYTLIALLIILFSGKDTALNIADKNIFNMEPYLSFSKFICDISDMDVIVNINEHIHGFISKLPNSKGPALYILIAISSIVTIVGYLFGTVENSKGRLGRIVDYAVFGNIDLFLSYLLVTTLFLSLAGIFPLLAVAFFGLGVVGNTGETSNSEENASQEESSSFSDTYILHNETFGERYYLYTQSGNHATLKDTHGNTYSVYKHGDNGLVKDDSGNLFRPE